MADPRFKRILFLVGICHLLLLGVFFWLSHIYYISLPVEHITWVDGQKIQSDVSKSSPAHPQVSPKPSKSSKSSKSSPAHQPATYHHLIHDRFYSQWNQPTTLSNLLQPELSCILEVQIAKDGTIMNNQIVGGNHDDTLDRSVLEASERIKQIDPLPSGIGKNGVYTVQIEFKFSS